MALENIEGGSTVHRRWMIAFAFGLVHGFGFSFDRADRLRQFLLRWAPLGAAQLAGILRGLMVLVAIAGVAWLIRGVLRSRLFRETPDKAADVA